MDWTYDDGGRRKYFKAENVSDCACRAIAIATRTDYKVVYDELAKMQKAQGRRRSARNGVTTENIRKYMSDHGWKWVPTMKVGSGCKVHMREDELPSGTVMCRLSGHVATVIDGVLHDTYDCTRGGTRCVYGYWTKR